MFTAALFTIPRTWKQLRYLLTDEWIKLWYIWYIYIMEYYSAIKKIKTGQICSFVVVWMNLEAVIQNEVSPKEKNI